MIFILLINNTRLNIWKTQLILENPENANMLNKIWDRKGWIVWLWRVWTNAAYFVEAHMLVLLFLLMFVQYFTGTRSIALIACASHAKQALRRTPSNNTICNILYNTIIVSSLPSRRPNSACAAAARMTLDAPCGGRCSAAPPHRSCCSGLCRAYCEMSPSWTGWTWAVNDCLKCERY